MNVVFYGRFSSHNQREESIEGQRAVCENYAKFNNYNIIKEYIDREHTGTNDNRFYFQQMIKDSESGQFEAILVYRLDRFARKREDFAKYKAILKKNGVKLISALETMPDGTSSILVEGMFETLSEYYSAELAQKVKRGMKSNAEKGLYNGGYVFLGYKIEQNENKQKKFVIDENTAYIVRDIFNMYNNDHTMQEIADYLNSKGIKTTQGKDFRKGTVSTILKNKRYTGVYMYNGIEIEGGMPRIIEDNVFEQAQQKMESVRKAPAKAKAKVEFLLTGKLYCGHCKSLMSGTSGTSQTGALYRYYVCNGVKEKKCNKRRVPKDYIEQKVIQELKNVLTKKNIGKIAKKIGKLYTQTEDSNRLKLLQNELKNAEQKRSKILNRVIECEDENIRKSLYEEMTKLDNAKINIEKEILTERENHIALTEDDVAQFFTEIKDGNLNDIRHQRILINVLVDRIFLYDDRITMVVFSQNRKVVIDKSLLEEAESSFSERVAQPLKSPIFVEK